MADNKQMEFRSSAQIDGKMTAGMARLMKQVEENQRRTLNFYKENAKGMGKWIKDEKELIKIQKNESNKLLREREQLLKNIGRAVDHNVKLYERAERTAQRYARLQARGVAKAWGMDPNTAIVGPADVAKFQGRALANIQGGAGTISQIEAEAAEMKATQRQQSLMKAGLWLQTAGQAANIVGDLFGKPLERLQNQAVARSFAGRMYDEISSGDYTSLWAISQDPGAIKDIARNAQIQARLYQVGRGVVGAGKFAIGAGMAGAGAATPAGALALAYGTQQMLGGASDVVNAIAGATYTKETQAAVTRGAMAAMEAMRDADPIKRRQFQEFASRGSMMADLGNMAGGIGPTAWKLLAMSGIAGGMTDREALPLFMSLRSGIGQLGAEKLLPTATTSMYRYGMDRNAAVGALINLSGATMAGGAANADKRLEDIFTRSFRAGLQDTSVQTALATGLPGLLGGVGGRAIDTGHAAGVIAAATQGFGGGMGGLSMAMQAYQGQGAIGGTGGPIQALNVAQAGSVFSVASKYGLSRETQLALVTVASQNPAALKEARPGSYIWSMIEKEGKDPGPILAELGAGSATTFQRFTAGFQNPFARNIIIGGVTGMSGEVVGASARMLATPWSATVGTEQFVGVGGAQGQLNKFQRGNAANQVLPVLQHLQALGDAGASAGLANLAQAGSIMSNLLYRTSQTNAEGLENVAGIIDDLTVAITNLGIAANNILKGMSGHTPGAPVQTSTITSTNTGGGRTARPSLTQLQGQVGQFAGPSAGPQMGAAHRQGR